MKKVIFKILGGLIVAIFILQYTGMVYADEISELQEQQSSNEEELKEAEEQKEQVTQEKSETLQQIEEIESQITDYEDQISELETKIENLNTQITEAEEQISQKEEDYASQKELLEKRLVVTYEAGETSFLDVLLSSKNIIDLISNYYMISEITESDLELMEKIKSEQEEIEAAKQTLEASKQELDSAKAEKQQKTVELQSIKSEKDSYVEQLTEEEKETQAELEQFEQDKKEIQAQLEEIAKQEAASSSNVTTITSNPSSSGYIRPVSGYSITTGWMAYSGHTGVDFSGSGIAGQPVLAVKAGTVVTSTALKYSNGSYRSYGEYIIINHHDGTMTLYAHGLEGSRLVSAGETVSQGQQIMSVGSTGNSTGYHLHFEVRVNGVAVNPTQYLP